MRGGNAIGIRAYNEQLVISAILDGGSLSKAELARRTGLSPNAAMVIVNRLIGEGLLRKQPRIEGLRGQPSVPIALHPDGAFSVGVNIGRRSVQSLLIAFTGEIIAQREQAHDYPDPVRAVDTAMMQCRRLLSTLDPPEVERVVGLGIALPGELHAWAEELGLAPGALDDWRDKDVQGILGKSTGLKTTLYNDASAACAAEMVAGDGITKQSALYLFFGTFVGGGVVIDGRLHQGARMNAGAIGSMPAGPAGARNQLIHRASILQLESMMTAKGLDPVACLGGDGGEAAQAVFETWLDTAVPAVAQAVVSALSVIDFETVVVDGIMPPRWRRQLRTRIIEALRQQNMSGLLQPEIATGSIGPFAPVLGAAMMPLRARFSPDPNLVVKRQGVAQS